MHSSTAPKSRALLEAEKAAQLAQELEKERQFLIQQEYDRIVREKENLLLKISVEKTQAEIRDRQLSYSEEKIRELLIQNELTDILKKNETEWQKYLECDQLSCVFDCPQLNTYLYSWKRHLDLMTMETLTEKVNIVLEILQKLNYFVENPLDFKPRQINNYKEIISDLESTIRASIDAVTYKILSNVAKNMIGSDGVTLTHSNFSQSFDICLWTYVKKPVALKNPKDMASERIQIKFEQLKLDVVFPESIQAKDIVVRALWLKFDHYSKTSKTFRAVENEKYFNRALKECMEDEVREKNMLYAKLSLLTEPIDKSKIKLSQDGAKSNAEKERTVDDQIVLNDANNHEIIRSSLLVKVSQNVINMRQFIVIGGVIDINLYYQPSQPNILMSRRSILIAQLPKELESVHFYYQYIPPPTPEAGVRRAPEEIEAEIKQMESEFDQLILINLEIPDTIMIFEPPTICRWDDEKRAWVTDDIHDLKYNEDKFTLAFRTGRLGIFGIAVSKFINFPFQTWELKPQGDGVIFSLTSAIIAVEFLIIDDTISFTQLQNGTNDALQDQVGVFYKFTDLKNLLRLAGINLFPAFDTFSYIEGHCVKHWPMEKHVYYCMAFLSVAFNFQWSRWNSTIKRRHIILQCREVQTERRKQPSFSTISITPESATYIDCTEVNQSLNTNSLHENEFYSDLLHLVRERGGLNVAKKLDNANVRLVGTVAHLLTATRVLSLA